MNTRLNKRMVELGLVSSRRKADELIQTGGVKVNGSPVENLATRVSEDDSVTLYGRSGKAKANITIAFNKPVGYICTHRSQRNGQKTIFDLLPLNFASLKIAGRLDKDSQGLMLLSSDGELIQKVSHPSQGKSKTYSVHLDKKVDNDDLSKLLAGVKLADGMSKFAEARRIKPQIIRVVLTEGRNRQIRRSFEALGYKVIKLERTKIGNMTLGLLTPGEHRFIKPTEVLDA